jgi:hypothetical protein
MTHRPFTFEETRCMNIAHKLIWSPDNSLVSWAKDAACAVLDDLPVGHERAGYRHLTAAAGDGVVRHELVDLVDRSAVCVIYRQPGRPDIAGVCQPWPTVLQRFVTAVLTSGLLPVDDPEIPE